MAYELWDVALTPSFPNQENKKEVTARPVIVIEDLQDEVEVCPVTKQLNQKNNYKYTIEVMKDSPEGIAMGLDYDSLIVLDRTTVFKKSRLVAKIGKCPTAIINKIEGMKM